MLHHVSRPMLVVVLAVHTAIHPALTSVSSYTPSLRHLTKRTGMQPLFLVASDELTMACSCVLLAAVVNYV